MNQSVNQPTPPVQKQQSTLGAFFKWATIGFLGFIGMIMIFGIILISKLSPLMEVGSDGKSHKFFGGSIEIHDNDDDATDSSDWDDASGNSDGKLSRIDGSLNEKILALNFDAINGSVEVVATEEAGASFDCEVRSKGPVDQGEFIRDQASENVSFVFDDNVKLSWCKFTLPQVTAVNLKLTNGDVSLKQMKNPATVELVNGRITFDAAESARYKLDARATNGMVMGRDAFDKAQAQIASAPHNPRLGSPSEVFQASLQTTNGVIIIE